MNQGKRLSKESLENELSIIRSTHIDTVADTLESHVTALEEEIADIKNNYELERGKFQLETLVTSTLYEEARKLHRQLESAKEREEKLGQGEELVKALDNILKRDDEFENSNFEICGCDESKAWLVLNRKRKGYARDALASFREDGGAG